MKKYCLLILLSLLLPAISAYSRDNGLNFIENKNQWEPIVKYRAELPGGAVYITDQGFAYSFYSISDANSAHEKMHENADIEEINNTVVHGHAYRVNFVNANSDITYTPAKKRITYYNYFLGNDPSKWAGHVGAYGKLVQHNVYAGIDAAVYSTGNSMKYDFLVAAGADPAQIILNFDGVDPQITGSGTLKIVTTVNEIEEGEPYAYQWVNGQQSPVACRYKKLANGNITFEFPNGYDSRRALVIDPTLVFGTFSGSTGNTYGFSACYDAQGALFSGGESFTTGWPANTGAFQTTFGGGVDCGLNKYSSDGTTLIFGTYYGGSGSEQPNNMITNGNNELAVMGSTTSSNLPVSTGCYQSSLSGSNDFFVVHFSADGSSLIGATYVGGSGSDASNAGTSSNYGDQNRGELFFDVDGNIIVAGSSSSTNFPTTANAFQPNNAGGQDGVVFKLTPDCATLLYSTYIGGAAADACFALVTNANNEIVVCGGTKSNNFPTTPGAMFETFQGQTDGFAFILNLGSGLVHSTYLGTSAYDHAFKIQLDGNEDVLVMGQTQGAYPVSSDVYAISNGNIFIDKLESDLSASIASTRLGTPQNPSGGGFVPTAFLYDNCNNTYLCGFQSDNSLPTTPDAFQSSGSGGFWFCTLDPDWVNLSYASYYGNSDHVDGGSSRFDPQGIIYHSVCTIDQTFPTTPTAYSPTDQASGWDVASFKFNFEANSLQANIGINATSNDSGCAPLTVTFDNLTTGALTYFWDFGDGTTTTDFAPTHTFTSQGVYNVMLAVSNPNSCNTDDTAYYPIHVFKTTIPQIVVSDTGVCDISDIITLTASIPNLTDDMTIHWSPLPAIVSDPNQLSVQVDPSISQTFQITVIDSVGNGMCVDSGFDFVNISLAPLVVNMLNNDTAVCFGSEISLYTEGPTTNNYTYSTSGPDNIIWSPNGQNTFATVNEAGVFKVTVEDNRGCIGLDSIFVNVYNIYPTVTPSDSGVCPGDSLQYTVTGGDKYLWVPGTFLSDSASSSPVATPAGNIDYTVYISTDEGCVDSQKVHLSVYPNAIISLPDSVSLYPGESYQMDPQGNGLYFQWFPPSGLNAANISNPIAQPDVRTRYFVTATTEQGCTVLDSIDILVWETLLDMPNAFVPGNGLNNVFKPVKRGIAKLNSFVIFNRWGNKIYESMNIDQGWDGTYKGKPQPIGVYMYIIDAVKDNGEPFIKHGNVTLMR